MSHILSTIILATKIMTTANRKTVAKRKSRVNPRLMKRRKKLAKKSDEGGSNNSPLNTPATSKGKKYICKKEKAINIPKFEEIAKTTNSKSDFLNGVISFFRSSKRSSGSFSSDHRNLSRVRKNNLGKYLSSIREKVAFNSYNRRVICDCVTKKLNLRFINVIASINRILSEHKGNSPAGVENTNDSEKKVRRKL